MNAATTSPRPVDRADDGGVDPEYKDEVDYNNYLGTIEYNGLFDCNTLDEVFKCVGYEPGDLLSRREQIILYQRVSAAFEARIDSLVTRKRFMDAKERRKVIEKLRLDFEALQVNDQKRHQEEQWRQFRRGKKFWKQRMAEEHQADIDKVSNYVASQEAFFKKKHAFQAENLERHISQSQQPRLKYSTRLQYLTNAEKSLARLNEFDDAKNVNGMINKILPLEKRNAELHWKDHINVRRRKLQNNQKEEMQRVKESLAGTIWRERRVRDRQDKILEQRLKNLEKDMRDSHLKENARRIEMTLQPSSNYYKRPGFDTSSSLRGQQLLNSLKEDVKADQVYVQSLIKMHDFENIPLGTEVSK